MHYEICMGDAHYSMVECKVSILLFFSCICKNNGLMYGTLCT